MKADRWETFIYNSVRNFKENFDCPDVKSDWTVCHNEISQKIKLYPDSDHVIQKFTSAITAACDTTYQATRSGTKLQRN
jgi:hypothetical protein